MPPPVTRTFHRFACSSQFRWGALLMQVGQDEAKSFCFKATHPCIDVYHCAGLHLLTHIANGMYGMILVEPEQGSAKVEREFYLMQSSFYTSGMPLIKVRWPELIVEGLS